MIRKERIWAREHQHRSIQRGDCCHFSACQSFLPFNELKSGVLKMICLLWSSYCYTLCQQPVLHNLHSLWNLAPELSQCCDNVDSQWITCHMPPNPCIIQKLFIIGLKSLSIGIAKVILAESLSFLHFFSSKPETKLLCFATLWPDSSTTVLFSYYTKVTILTSCLLPGR